MSEQVILQLAPYMNCGYRNHRDAGLWGREAGLKAAKDLGILKLGGKEIVLDVPPHIRMDEPFMKALLGPVARKVGPANLKVTVSGGFRGGVVNSHRGWGQRR